MSWTHIWPLDTRRDDLPRSLSDVVGLPFGSLFCVNSANDRRILIPHWKFLHVDDFPLAISNNSSDSGAINPLPLNHLARLINLTRLHSTPPLTHDHDFSDAS